MGYMGSSRRPMGRFMTATGVVTTAAACGVAAGRDLTTFIASLVTGLRVPHYVKITTSTGCIHNAPQMRTAPR